ncbi:GntR family transcriptional regulator [Streptomyces litmocidini]|uniref:GntR family transcriptional regulator n=1 Tax=Streptomyces litmocidini TaxID=67318 RepID=UPI00167E2891|nr:GntR family transcriptional regulator [Streptomyces litmocidini]GGV18144.1 GntR family transcriptional regulator [Streptomyces litmocidini]
MEQGAARERATERPSPPFGGATGAVRPEPTRPEPVRTPSTRPEPPHAESVRVPEQTRGTEQGRGPEHARGEHTHGEPAPGPRTVRRHSVRGQVLEALRTALVGGELRPGEVYSAPALAERFGVSATPVREAMQRLAVEGAVEVVPNRGFRVTERTPRELAELAEVRALIEVPVMLRLARTVPAARWAELRPLAEATATAAARGDRAHYAETDRAFHRAVLSLAGNEQLLAVADDLHRRSQWPLISAPALRHGDLVADAAEHTALLDALIAQDLTVVQALVREHFAGSDR